MEQGNLNIQAMLAEKLVNNVETHVDPEMTRLHCAVAKWRRAEVLSGEVQPVEGNEALNRVRKSAIINHTQNTLPVILNAEKDSISEPKQILLFVQDDNKGILEQCSSRRKHGIQN